MTKNRGVSLLKKMLAAQSAEQARMNAMAEAASRAMGFKGHTEHTQSGKLGKAAAKMNETARREITTVGRTTASTREIVHIQASQLPQMIDTAMKNMIGAESFSDNKWHGGLYERQGIVKALREGSDFMLAESKAMLDQIHAMLDLSGLAKTTELGVVGSSPCVPSFLAGAPCCMRRTVDVESDHALTPVTVYLSLVSSMGVSAELLAKRAAAVLAFTQALSMIRPVQLTTISATRPDGHPRDVALLVDVGMAPMDLTSMCALLHPGVQRVGIYAWMDYQAGHKERGSLAWPATPEAVLVGCKPGDMFFAAPRRLGDIRALTEAMEDPVKWVQEQLELALKGQGAAYQGAATC